MRRGAEALGLSSSGRDSASNPSRCESSFSCLGMTLLVIMQLRNRSNSSCRRNRSSSLDAITRRASHTLDRYWKIDADSASMYWEIPPSASYCMMLLRSEGGVFSPDSLVSHLNRPSFTNMRKANHFSSNLWTLEDPKSISGAGKCALCTRKRRCSSCTKCFGTGIYSLRTSMASF